MDSSARFPRAVVFDLDGTLVDSAPDIGAALTLALADEGLPAFDLEAVKTMIGGGSRRLIERALVALSADAAPARIEHMTQAFERCYLAEPCRATSLYPGAVALLQSLAARGTGIGLCTNKPAQITGRLLTTLGIDRHFGAVVAGSDVVPKKPDPAMLLTVMSRLGTSPRDTVLVGDSAADVGCARNAGCRVVLVSYGYAGGPAAALGADAVIDHLDQALTVLGGLFAGAAPRDP